MLQWLHVYVAREPPKLLFTLFTDVHACVCIRYNVSVECVVVRIQVVSD